MDNHQYHPHEHTPPLGHRTEICLPRTYQLGGSGLETSPLHASYVLDNEHARGPSATNPVWLPPAVQSGHSAIVAAPAVLTTPNMPTRRRETGSAAETGPTSTPDAEPPVSLDGKRLGIRRVPQFTSLPPISSEFRDQEMTLCSTPPSNLPPGLSLNSPYSPINYVDRFPGHSDYGEYSFGQDAVRLQCLNTSNKKRPKVPNSVSLRMVHFAGELAPVQTAQPIFRRANPEGGFISPLEAITIHLATTYRLCNRIFQYESSRNPRRVLTKPNNSTRNDGYDNEDSDYILYVNDILGSHDGHRYLILDVLGQGTFGQVVKCQNLKTQEVVAVKVVKNKPAYFNQSMMEVTILDMLNNKLDKFDEHHILRLIDTFIHRQHLCLVFELLSVNLYELIKQNSFKGLSINLVRLFAGQLLDALSLLNDSKLIHCDLKPENILLKSLESPAIKVIDFGSACHERQTVYTYIQSRFYRSPEVLLGLPYTTAIDMWSLGCIVGELFLGLPLFPGSSEYNQISRIVEMLGPPPNWMIEMGKQGETFFEKQVDERGNKTYKLKSMEKFSREYNSKERPSKKYFSGLTLSEIILSYPVQRRTSKPIDEAKEMRLREVFKDFISGLLTINPIERWSPQQARLHPFITGEPFTGRFVPPMLMKPLSGDQITPIANPQSDPNLTLEKFQQHQQRTAEERSYREFLRQQNQKACLGLHNSDTTSIDLISSYPILTRCNTKLPHLPPPVYFSPKNNRDTTSQQIPSTSSGIALTNHAQTSMQRTQAIGYVGSNNFLPSSPSYTIPTDGYGDLTCIGRKTGIRARASTLSNFDSVPPKLRKATANIDISDPILPSPAFYPPPDINSSFFGEVNEKPPRYYKHYVDPTNKDAEIGRKYHHS